jgi:hypothetical protein
MDTKRCTKCTEVKLLQDFSTRAKGELRVAISICRECSNLQAKEIYSRNRESRLISSARRYDPVKANNYYRVNAARIKEKTSEITTNRRNSDPLYKFTTNTRCVISSAFKRAVKGAYSKSTGDTTRSILGCSFEDFASYITSQFTEGMTLENYGQWHLDHRIPLATAKTREDVVRLNHYTNFQPLWAKDNLSKGAKIIVKIVAG